MKALRGAIYTASLAAIAAATAGSAAAQTGEAPAEEATEGNEIVVTATRREERLQDVPLAVSAVSGEALASSGYREVSDVQYLAPNITFSATNPVSNGGGYQIRGIGTQTFDSGVEQTVGLVVDGVVIGLSRDPGATGFADIERIEVLRGPQGTLFGKNSSAGVIQIVTRKPQLGESTLDLDFAYGERDDQVQRGTFNLPIGQSAAVRVSAFHTSQEGAIRNVVNGTHVGDRNNYGVRGKLLVEPNDGFSVLLAGEYQTGFARDAQTIESLGVNPVYNALFAQFPVQPGHGVYLSFQDGDWTARQRLWSVQGEVNVGLGDHTLTSITAYRALKSTQLADIDAAPIDIFNNSDGAVDSNQFTQELRLTSPAGERIEYVAGLYYYHTENAGYALQYGNFYGRFGVPVVLAGGRRDQTNLVRSYAAFGQASFALTDTLKLIGGLRYTNDRNKGTLVVTPIPFPALVLSPGIPYDGVVKADNLSGKAAIQYQPNRDLMLYASYATGYKGPAIDGTGGVVTEVKPETVKSYELGVKSTLADGAVTLNATLYWSDFKNFQTTGLDSNRTPPAFLLTNAGAMRARGVELEGSIRIARGLRFSASGAYSDSTYREYLGPCYAGQPVSAPGGGGCYTVPGATTQVADYAGFRLPNAPEWSYTLRLDLDRPVSDDLKLDAGVNWAWRDATQAVLGDPNARIDDYGLLNGTIGLGSEDGAWRIGLYARNLFNRHFYAPYAATAVINPGGYSRIMSPEAFRTIGAAARFSF